MEHDGALRGLKVLDMGRVLAAPFCTSILASMGADVIKLESPGRGDDARQNLPMIDSESSYFIQFNHSKRGITLDLKKGRDVFLKLVAQVDVIVENFRPGVMAKLGLSYDELKKVNPGLIYCAISGFGQSGPYSQQAGYDPVAQALSGVMSVTGWPDGAPSRCGASIGDIMAGENAAVGILAALYHRSLTGEGQMIDIALVDSCVTAMASVNLSYLAAGKVPQRQGNGYTAGAPGNSYRCKDGEAIFLALNQSLWERLCAAIGREDLLQVPEFKDNAARVRNRAMLDAELTKWTSARTVEEVVNTLLAAKLPAAPILTVDQVVANEHIGGVRNMFPQVEHPVIGKVRITNQPIKMSKTNPYVRSASPMLGEHNRDIYREFGFSPDEIAAMKASGVI